MTGWRVLPRETPAMRWIGVIAVPFGLHFLLLALGYRLLEPFDMWAISGVVPVFVGLVFLERAVGGWAAGLAVLYAPCMLWLLFMLNMVLEGVVFGEPV